MALTDLKFRATNANVTTLISSLSLNSSQVVDRPLTHEELDTNFLYLAKHTEDMNTDAIAEGSSNLYFTNARARAAISTTAASASGNGSLAYNSSTGVLTFTPANVPTNTDGVAEGSSNLYYTDARVLTKIQATSINSLSDVVASSPSNGQILKYNSSNSRFELAADSTPANTDAVSEGSTNLYFTNARVDSRIGATSVNALSDVNTSGAANGKILKYNGTAWVVADDSGSTDTDSLTEGSSNLYFTNARADARIAAASVNALSDVTITTPAANNVLKYNGTAWVNTTSIDLEKFTANTGNQNNVSMFTRFEPSAAQTYRTLNLRAESSTNMTHDGYGPSLGFMVRDDAGVDNSIGSISCVRDGADNTGKFAMSLYNAGTFNEVMTIDKDGNTTRTGSIGLKELASAPNTLADHAHIYSKDVAGVTKIFIQDSSGTEKDLTLAGTTLSGLTDTNISSPSDGQALIYSAGASKWIAGASGGGSGETNDGLNVGTAGIGIYKDKSSSTLRFRKINAGSNKVTVTLDSGNDEVDIDVSPANIISAVDTDALSEGSTNQYHTTARVNSAFDTRLATKSTTNLSEGTNLYFTNARADARIAAAGINALSDVDTTGVATNKILKYNGSNWVVADDSGGIALTNLSVTTGSASGSGTLAYNNSSGVFTFQPADLTSYLTSISGQNLTTLSDVATVGASDNNKILYYEHSSTSFKWKVDAGGPADTDALSEGSSNLYFTNARADARITNAIVDEDNMASDSNTKVPTQQSVKAYVDSQILTKDNTDEITEGSSNLYFTNTRADARIAAASVNALSDVTVSSASTGQVLKWSGSAWTNQADLSTPGGATTQVQFNDSGAFGGDSTFTFNKTTDTLYAKNIEADSIAPPSTLSGTFTISSPTTITLNAASGAGEVKSEVPFRLMPKTVAQLQGGFTASAGSMVSVSDNGYKPAYYNGSNWKYVATDGNV